MFENLELELVPKISRDKLEYLISKIVPLVPFKYDPEENKYVQCPLYEYTLEKRKNTDGSEYEFKNWTQNYLYTILNTYDPISQSFIWSAKADEPAADLGFCFPPYGTIITYHKYGAPSLFKPSIEEVLAQINLLPEKDINIIRAFWVDSDDLDAYNIIGHYHFTKTTLFQKYIKATDGSNTIIGYETHNGSIYYKDLKAQGVKEYANYK